MEEHFGDEVVKMRAEIASLQKRLLDLERRISGQAQPAKPPLPSPKPPPPPLPQRSVAEAAPSGKPLAELLPSSLKPATADESAKKKPALSLEQRVGASWLNKIGIVVLILAAVFFFQYAAQQGWISPMIRVVVVALAGLALLLAGEWTFRKAMRMFATGATGGGIALLYAAAYAASPKFYSLVNTPTAFGLMCAVTLIGVLLSLRSGAMATAILVQIGAYATPMLLSTGRDEQVVLMTYLIVVSAGFLTVSVIKKWDVLPPISLAGTLVLFAGWFYTYYDTPATVRTLVFAWSLFGLFLVYSVAATAARRTHQFTGIAVTTVGAAAMVLLWMAMDAITRLSRLWMDWNPELAAWVLPHLVTLNAIILAACLLRRWHWLRAVALLWTMVGVFVFSLDRCFDVPGKAEYFSTWIWIFFGLFTVDILIRAWWRNRRTNERLDAVLATAATAAMFWATYALLHDSYEKWMGLYTASLAVAAIALSIGLIRTGRRRILGYAYLGQGLVLLTLAMPIQFDKASLTVAWAAQAAVTMLLARRLNIRLLLVKSPIVLILAVAHFAMVDVPDDSRLAAVMMTVGGVEIIWLMLLAAGLTASAFVSAALVPIGKDSKYIACGLVWLGTGVWVWQTCMNLPAVAATWWWLMLASLVAAVGLWRRREWLAGSAGVMLAAVAGKILAYDTLYHRLAGVIHADKLVVLNWQFAAGVAIGVICLLYAKALSRRFRDWKDAGVIQMVAVLLGALLVVWVGSFEVNRYFTKPPADLPINAEQAEQMAYSIWWAVYAAGLLIIGFVVRYSPVRYFALALFAVTLGKVLLVDMADIEAGYRIASFLALGVLLLAASFLYQRYFREALANWDKR